MKPLDHRRWKLIYLLTILLTLMFAPYGKADITNRQTEKPIVEYHWKVLNYHNNLMRIRELMYGKTPKRQKTSRQQKVLEIPEPQPSPHQASFEIQRRRHRNRQHRFQSPALEDPSSSRLARSLRRQNLRGNNRASPQSASGKRTLYGSVSPVSARGAT
jgi:hypothetical protein